MPQNTLASNEERALSFVTKFCQPYAKTGKPRFAIAAVGFRLKVLEAVLALYGMHVAAKSLIVLA